MRFSGHQTFPLRYAWMPHAYRILSDDPDGLDDDARAMQQMGIGRNMLKALRFWAEVTGIARRRPDVSGMHITPFGRAVLGQSGFDPYLEDVRTIWLMHWKIATCENPVFAWFHMLYEWATPDFTRSLMVRGFAEKSIGYDGRERSDITLTQHVDMFLHSYFPSRRGARSVEEDILDCPFHDLRLIEKIGERTDDSGRTEPLLAFRRDGKPEITDDMFLYCLDQDWAREYPTEHSLTLHQIAYSLRAPGRTFMLDERSLLERLENVERASHGAFVFQPSAAESTVVRSSELPRGFFLEEDDG